MLQVANQNHAFQGATKHNKDLSILCKDIVKNKDIHCEGNFIIFIRKVLIHSAATVAGNAEVSQKGPQYITESNDAI